MTSLPDFLNISGPVDVWAHNMVLQACLMLLGTLPFVPFQDSFTFVYCIVVLPIYTVLEYQHNSLKPLIQAFTPWHNYLVRSIFYLVTSIPMFVQPTAAVLPGTAMLLAFLLYLWSWGLDEPVGNDPNNPRTPWWLEKDRKRR